MKIDTDLRFAIKAAIRQHNETKCNWSVFREDQEAAVKKLAESPKYRARIKRAKAGLAEAEALKEKHSKIFSELGISHDLDRIYDDDKFEAAGGLVVTKHKTLDADSILADIAKADKRQAEAIIKKLGIKWE